MNEYTSLLVFSPSVATPLYTDPFLTIVASFRMPSQICEGYGIQPAFLDYLKHSKVTIKPNIYSEDRA
jgi:hypothetical protein